MSIPGHLVFIPHNMTWCNAVTGHFLDVLYVYLPWNVFSFLTCLR